MALELILNKIRLKLMQRQISQELYDELYQLIKQAYTMGMKTSLGYKEAKNKKKKGSAE